MNICAAITRGWYLPPLLFFFAVYSYSILLVAGGNRPDRTYSFPDQRRHRFGPVLLLHAGIGAAGFTSAIAAHVGRSSPHGADHAFSQPCLFSAVAAAAAIGADRCGGLSQHQTALAPISRWRRKTKPAEWQALFGTHAIMPCSEGRQTVSLQRRIRGRVDCALASWHDWQWLQPGKGWDIPAACLRAYRGGREDGYRYYTIKTATQAGPMAGQYPDFGRPGGGAGCALRSEEQAVPPAVTNRILK